MLPLIFLGGSALFLAGCSGRKESRSLPMSPSPSPGGREKTSSYTYAFKDDELARGIHRQFKDLGIAESQFDRGCSLYSYEGHRGLVAQLEGRGDFQLTACEVYDYVLQHAEQHPGVAQQVTGHPLPWSLDDYDPETKFDKKIRDDFRTPIASLGSLLRQKGYVEGTVEYQERMAVALTYAFFLYREFVANPLNKKHVQGMLEELEELGIKAVGYQLIRDAFPAMPSARGVEFSALNALEKWSGDCTEKSKILYAVFKTAGLSPFFVYVDPFESEEPFLKEMVADHPSYRHVCIGLRLGKRVRLLDPALVTARPKHRKYYPLNLRQYLSLDFLNRGSQELPDGDLDLAWVQFEQGMRLGDPFGLNTTGRGHVRYYRKDLSGAIADLAAAIKKNPQDASFYLDRAIFFAAYGDLDRALTDYQEAVRRNPRLSTAYLRLGILLYRKGEKARALQHLQKYIILSPKRGPQLTAKELGAYFHSQWRGEEREKRFKLLTWEMGEDPALIRGQVLTVGLQWKAGLRGEAREALQKLREGIVTRGNQMAAQGRQLSPETRAFQRELLQYLPGEAVELKSLWKSLFSPAPGLP